MKRAPLVATSLQCAARAVGHLWCYDAILPLVSKDQRVDLIKIDVEGFETQVLRGMKDFIARNRPVIFCEIFGGKESNPDPQATVDLCCDFGYEPFVLKEGRLVEARRHDDEFYKYFLIPRNYRT